MNASNISTGILSFSRGGKGTTTLTSNQILIGNGTSALLQSSNLTWNNTSNTLSASNFVGSGSGLTYINASSISTGILSFSRGGIGSTTLTSNQLFIGNGTSALLRSANLTWNNTSNTLSASNFVGSGSGMFWIRRAGPVRRTSTQFVKHFQSSTPQSVVASGRPLSLLDPLPPLPLQHPRLQHLPQDPC